jgi:hypothetical protein
MCPINTWISEPIVGQSFKAFLSHGRVTTFKEDARWLLRGRQKRAVAKALRCPATPTQIRAIGLVDAPQMQLRDVWAILEQGKERGLIYCLNPRELKGKLFFWTERGRKVVNDALLRQITVPAARVNWKLYGWVARGKLRRVALLQIDAFSRKEMAPTASQIRRALRESYPVTLNSVLRTLGQLVEAKVIKTDFERSRKAYCLTAAGRKIIQRLPVE